MATTKPKPRPEEEIDVSPRAEAGDQFFVEEAEKKAKSLSDIKPKIRPDSDKYKGRTYDIYSVEVDGKETNVIEFKDGKRISTPQIRQMFEKYKSASEPILGKQTSQEISNFLEKNNPTYDEFIKHFTAKRLNKGGTPMLEEQMELFNEGGLKDEGGEVDPESGNDVPIGSTKKEVRDDIPAMLSEGEFVFPADVVRYIGLEDLMRLRQNAKMGLKKMEAMGQMGNSEEATLPDDMPFDMADLIIVTGKPEEDKPKEMAQGGVIQAQTGTFVPNYGIAGTRPSVFDQRVTSSYTPPSSSIAPTPISAPAGGYKPKFINQTTTTQQNPIDTIIQSDQVSANTSIDDEPFFETVEDVYTTKEYINPETGERRTFSFYQGNPITSIPDGFIPVEDYETDQTDTTDLESTSVQTTQVIGDDKGSDKRRLSNMTRQQSSNALASLKDAKPDAILDAWNKNQQTKAVMTSLALINPIVGMAGRAAASHFGNQLEKLMEDKGIEIPKQTEEKQNFIEKLGSGISNFFTGLTSTEEEGSTYAPIYRPEDSPFGMNADKNLLTTTNTGSMFTTSEAEAYDNAVNSGNVNVARHYEIINNRYNKMADFAAGIPVSGLSEYDEAQARALFDSEGNRKFDTVNQANAAAENNNNNNDNDKPSSTPSSEKNFVEKVFDSISSFFGGGSDDD